MTTDTTQVASPVEPTNEKKKHHIKVPSAFTILFLVTVLAVAATWLIPAGSYAKLQYQTTTHTLQVKAPDGTKSDLPATQESLDKLGVKIGIEKFTEGAITKAISIPGTYSGLPQKGQGVEQIPVSMVSGTIEGIDIIVFILVFGGLIGVVEASGAFESGLVALTKKTKGREFALVLFVSLFMVLGGSLCGLEEEAVAFYPILAPIFIALGYDSIITVGSIFMAGSIGTTFSTVNPFSTIIASNAAGFMWTEGLVWRVASCIVGAIVIICYLYWYGKKVKADPSFSYTYEDREQFNAQWGLMGAADKVPPFNIKRKFILVLFVAAFVLMVFGVMKLKWWFPQMAASFLTIAIIIMCIEGFSKGGKSEKQLVDAFSAGSSSLVAVALIIGLARGVNHVLDHGMISDTLLFWSSNLVSGMSGPLFIIMLMVVFFLLGFVVPSSSGLAVLSMPIFAPLADTVGIPRWIIVCAYQWGQYAMLYIAPTGLVMATLQMLDMKYQHWLKFSLPMVAFTFVFGAILCAIMTIIYHV